MLENIASEDHHGNNNNCKINISTSIQLLGG